MITLLEMVGHRCRVFRGDAAGLCRAHNALLLSTKKSLIARIDDDTISAQLDYLTLLVEAMLSDTTGLLVSGPIVHLRSAPQESYALPKDDAIDGYAAFEAPFIRYVQPPDAAPRFVTSLYSSFCTNGHMCWRPADSLLRFHRSEKKRRPICRCAPMCRGPRSVLSSYALVAREGARGRNPFL